MELKRITLVTLALLAACGAGFAAEGTPESKYEGKLEPFLGQPQLEIQQVFQGGRFPNIVTAVDGSVLAFWGGVVVRRSEDGGETWGPQILVGKGHMGGGVTVNETNGDIFAFVGERHPPTTETVYGSQDQGRTWAAVDVEIKPDSKGNKPEMHMNEHGITLRRGEHKGRLLRPARYYGKQNSRDEWPSHYTTAIYSDDGGETWLTSDPFPALGTGEAAVAELSDGRIYYNSRRHWAPEGVNHLRRWTAWSDDGGATWKDLAICEVLPDGPQDTGYGCMGGLVRLPVQDRDILLYSNCDSAGGRNKGTVWVSFDGGKTWPLKRLVTPGGFAYSSLDAGRPGTRSEGWIYLLFEGGGANVARFNLSWLLAGDKTGNGEVPNWIVQFSTTLPSAEPPCEGGSTAAGQLAEGNSESSRSEPSEAEQFLKTLDPFYKQHVFVDGVPVVSSEKVSEYALREVGHLTRKMHANRPDLLARLAERKMYVCVMAYNEMQTDLPECRGMSLWWAKRARGLGGRPVSCGEENLLDYPGDPYQGENIFIHEFAHGLHGAIGSLDEQFDGRLRALYEQAKQSGRFRGYGMNNHGEFWAEGVQSWFHCNRRGGLAALGPEGEHLCELHTRQQLKEHLPGLAALLDEVFRQNEWVYVPVRQRLDEPHMRGYDPAQSPTFVWPPEVIEAYNRIEAEKANKRKQREEEAAGN